MFIGITVPGAGAAELNVPDVATLNSTDSTRDIVKCLFHGFADRPHVSTTSVMRKAIQSHATWKWMSPCSMHVTATVKTQLMKSYHNRNPDDFFDVGTPPVGTIWPDGGSANRITAHYDCVPGETAWYKAWVDVDVNGMADSSKLHWSTTQKVTCA